jgi:hypothetical protein
MSCINKHKLLRADDDHVESAKSRMQKNSRHLRISAMPSRMARGSHAVHFGDAFAVFGRRAQKRE